jgi:hypothetical protein
MTMMIVLSSMQSCLCSFGDFYYSQGRRSKIRYRGVEFQLRSFGLFFQKSKVATPLAAAAAEEEEDKKRNPFVFTTIPFLNY